MNRLVPALLTLLLVSLSCDESPDGHEPPVEDGYCVPDTGSPLGATFDDPILLTIAAPRERTEYFADEGYTLTHDEVLALVTDTAGDLGIAFEVNGALYTGESQYHSPVTIQHTASDSILVTFGLTAHLDVEMRFVAATSRTLAVETWLTNTSATQTETTVLVWLRRCDGGYSAVTQSDGGLTAEHHVEISEEEALFAPGTFIEDAADALVLGGEDVTRSTLEECSPEPTADIAALAAAREAPTSQAAALALSRTIEVPAAGRAVQLTHRALVPEDRKPTLDDEIDVATSLDIATVLEQGASRLATMPRPPTDDPSTALLWHSSFTLLDQLMMPAEGNLEHAYYVFSREPTWWFARLGQHAHESLSMLTLARMDCDLALGSHRVFFDRIEDDGYLPYNVGPVVEQTTLGTTTAPFLSLVSWELYEECQDSTFLADAYTAGAAFHDFWVQQRDRDGDGLCEFGGFAISEATRDLNNVIWEEVTSPDQVEAIDLNSWLVMEAKSLSAMATELGLADEAQQWMDTADARAALINATMWDDETGFYYHVDHLDNDFEVSEPGDLKRMEIAGLLPLWAGITTADRTEVLLQKLTDPERFWRTHGVPSLAADDPSYDPGASSCCRWNGPVWVQWQWMMARALLDHGEPALAADLTERVAGTVTTVLAREHQFRELYDPDDENASNDSMPNYIWTAMAAQMLHETN